MNRRTFLSALLASGMAPGLLAEAVAQTPSPAQEWRGVWLSRFEWTKGDRAAIESRLRDIFSTLSQGNLNAILFQVRGQGDTLYPSPTNEPWSPLLSSSARRSDPVAFAIAEARRHRIEFHAWHNLSVIWQSGQEQPPKDPTHPFYRFAHPTNRNRSQGVIHDQSGKPMHYGESGYTWLTPGNPEVTTYIRQQVIAFLDKYDVDGLHWDDRTGLPHGASHDPVSLVRFKGRGNPEKITDLEQWQRDQLRRMLSDISVAAKARKQSLRISLSPFGIADKTRIPGYSRFSDATRDFGVDPELWLHGGVVDTLMPQVYWDDNDPAPNYSTVVRDWMRHNKSGRPIWPGSALKPWPGEQSLLGQQQVNIALARGLRLGGNTFWSYTAAEPQEWRSMATKAYATPATVPPTPRAPGGQIMGIAADGAGRPLADVHIRAENKEGVFLSGADGFFAVPAVPTGTTRLAFDAPGVSRQILSAEVAEGQTAIVRATLA